MLRRRQCHSRTRLIIRFIIILIRGIAIIKLILGRGHCAHLLRSLLLPGHILIHNISFTGIILTLRHYHYNFHSPARPFIRFRVPGPLRLSLRYLHSIQFHYYLLLAVHSGRRRFICFAAIRRYGRNTRYRRVIYIFISIICRVIFVFASRWAAFRQATSSWLQATFGPGPLHSPIRCSTPFAR